MYLSSLYKELLEAINNFGCTNDVGYIVEVMKKCLIEVGPQNVVQIYTNNISMMLKAVNIKQEHWPHLYI